MSTSREQPEPHNAANSGDHHDNSRNRVNAIRRCIGDSIRNPITPQYLIALFTFGLAVFAFYAWRESQNGTRALEGQLKAMQADQRPWIGAPTEIKTSVASGGKVTFIQIFRNVGRTPTSGFYIDGKIIPLKNDWYSDVRIMCDTAREAVTKGNPESISPYSSVPGSDWPLDVVSMPSLLGKSFTIESLKQMGKPPIIIGCVLYGSSDKIIHKTGYFAQIDIDGNNASIRFIYAVDAD